jgi:hypothetical protein
MPSSTFSLCKDTAFVMIDKTSDKPTKVQGATIHIYSNNPINGYWSYYIKYAKAGKLKSDAIKKAVSAAVEGENLGMLGEGNIA